MSKDIMIQYENKPCYEIKIRPNFEDLVASLHNMNQKSYNKVCVVTDSKVAKLCLKNMYDLLKNEYNQVLTFEFPNGESSKNMDTVEKLYQVLINSHFDRGDLLIALGGGVVGDLTGFTAATYLRGIDFVQVPTTLLSQVDSSIGGKTGVDFLHYKNMVGAFYMPQLVYINTDVLHTLEDVQFQSGMGEIIKHGLIRNSNYYDWLKAHVSDITTQDANAMEEMIYQSCLIKKNVVEIDPKELGIRAYLNFGHTVGHAVEKLSDFQLYHGQCVAIGMVSAGYLSMKRNCISQEEYDDMIWTIEAFGLPRGVDGLDPQQILAATKSDKKMVGNKIKFVILEATGNAAIDTEFTDDEILEAISVIC